ncbi:MAG: hypothetical protein COA97_10370 [Flavobacteriales bacterium]|nr:MAG: hypothetical protein COA97_10370 [Flavobacteriales bacterium]
MKFHFENINIGDEVYFESSSLQNNHDLYWKVIHKYEQSKEFVVQLNEMGVQDERWTIKLDEVKYHNRNESKANTHL